MPLNTILLVSVKNNDKDIFDQIKPKIIDNIKMLADPMTDKGFLIPLEDSFLQDQLTSKNESDIFDVNLDLRFFNQDYPKGDFLTISRIVKMFRKELTCSEIWYGEDSSDKVILLTPEYEEALLRHYCKTNPRANQ